MDENVLDKLISSLEQEKNDFREFVRDNKEMLVDLYIKTGTPVSEMVQGAYKDRNGHYMPAGEVEALGLKELDRKAETIAQRLGVECGYDQERIKREISNNPDMLKIATGEKRELTAQDHEKIKDLKNNVLKDDMSPKIHNLFQALMIVAINAFRQLAQTSRQGTQQEPAQLSSRQVPTAEEQHEMRARRQDINEQMSAALHSAPASAGAAYDNDMAQQEQQQQSNGMSLGR